MSLEFRKECLRARFRSPDGTDWMERNCEVRFDPLLGTSSRIAEGVKLQTADAAALEKFRHLDPACPFCPERIERVTPRIRPEICPEGRIRLGDTLVFPNLVPYSQYAAVAVFSPRHWLSLQDFTPDLIASNLTAAFRYIRAVYAFDPKAQHCAYNINYLYPSGGSLPHPHSQVFLDPYPTTLMRMQQQEAERFHSQQQGCYWHELVEAEKRTAARFITELGNTVWFTAFAPIGFNEVRAVVRDQETLLDLTGPDIRSIAEGVSLVLGWYESIHYDSFNLVLYSGPLSGSRSYRVNLAIMTRTSMVPFYRSDAMYMERMHWEAAVDRLPESLAGDLRNWFATARNR
jgi:galactose-1-phosphate uridylyltransferase